MSAVKLKAVPLTAPDPYVADSARKMAASQTHNLMLDAVDALKALARGDDNAADASLKLVLIACANARTALQPALLPPSRNPKAEVDAGLQEWSL